MAFHLWQRRAQLNEMARRIAEICHRLSPGLRCRLSLIAIAPAFTARGVQRWHIGCHKRDLNTKGRPV
jgi:hypothetical protein